MALPLLVNNAECGPANPLQGLSKRFDQDRGVQQDHFGAGRAGTSRETFRSSPAASVPDQDAARFFGSATSPPPQLAAPSAFQLNALRNALPQHTQDFGQINNKSAPNLAAAGWASDFLQSQKSPAMEPNMAAVQQAQMSENATQKQMHNTVMSPQGNMNWNPAFAPSYRMSPGPQMMGHMPMQAQQPATQNSQVLWDQAFLSREDAVTSLSEMSRHEENQHTQEEGRRVLDEGDELSRNAALLLDSVREEQNPKFKNSQFMGLMKQFRDREMVVEGNEVVENKGQNAGQEEMKVDVKGKGRAVEDSGRFSNVRGGFDYGPQVDHLRDPALEGSYDTRLGQSEDRNQKLDRLRASMETLEMLKADEVKWKQRADELEQMAEKYGATGEITDGAGYINRGAYEQIANSLGSDFHSQSSDLQALLQRLEQSGRQSDKSTELLSEVSKELSRVLEASENANDAYFRQDNEDYMRFWNEAKSMASGRTETRDTMDWGHLQDDWDRFEATATGIRPIANYQFQANNPYLLGDSSRTRHHMLHDERPQTFFESVLELEAAVQRDMTDAKAWFELGVKQQENEREQKAIHALERALSLDPSHLPSWLALAISYTNDNNRQKTYESIQEWVTRNEEYRGAVERFNAENPVQQPEMEMEGAGDKLGRLVQCLIAMARSSSGQEVDAEIQIALAVLLNTSEDYEKAKDCFEAALAVRPEDWLLYNRVGATMANSGRPNDALQFYYKALELNPAYIRARYNLGISCINLRRYDEAGQHILDALVLQDSDGIADATGMNDKRGVTSDALWDSLRTCCLHMQRADLAGLCDRRDLDSFRDAFHS